MSSKALGSKKEVFEKISNQLLGVEIICLRASKRGWAEFETITDLIRQLNTSVKKARDIEEEKLQDEVVRAAVVGMKSGIQ